jgi:hypothetical protein
MNDVRPYNINVSAVTMNGGRRAIDAALKPAVASRSVTSAAPLPSVLQGAANVELLSDRPAKYVSDRRTKLDDAEDPVNVQPSSFRMMLAPRWLTATATGDEGTTPASSRAVTLYKH